MNVKTRCGMLLALWALAATAPAAVKGAKRWVTTDHAKHEALKQPFTSGPEVTKACLSCHSEAATQIHKTIHWTWVDPASPKDKPMGKGALTVNNYCVSIHGNEPRCTSCHIGYGWKDKSFDFTDASKVDCLVCHEQTGTYKKHPAMAGLPAKEPVVFPGDGQKYLPPEWNKVAQSVARPGRENCGVCHFYGGGGDMVKHGDLDSSMTKPNKALDVHMGVDGKNFDCTRCHTTSAHQVAGRIYSTPAATERKTLAQDDLTPRITCESCHTATPHKPGVKANDHTDKVACQSCHIPEFARALPTKMRWDWSTAGKKKDGKPYKEKGPLGTPVYDTQKGNFTWEKNVRPQYFWYNGTIDAISLKDAIDPTRPVALNWPVGKPSDPNARIAPFKVHTGKQPYDTVNKTMLVPHLFGPPDSDAYWAKYDWKLAFESGQKKAGLPFSGQFDFVETSYVFPTTHMVAPKETSVACNECHTRDNGRMAGIPGIYLPGRDGNRVVEFLGWATVIGSLAGVALHALGRAVSSRRKEG
ncbi:MAG: tetrathionate reductase family octaheme c-type cytochrome [Desulfobacterales bacterium]|nr:tetrathionate reductase family octaheme c-type cytochrome [Desulfobacterales bacterium]